MLSFDFITDDTFRQSLEQDYHELNACMEAKAWKAVHVLAGSIIEAVLTDYLLAVGYNGKSTETILKMHLADIINACKNENVLTQKTAELSSVVKEYRNLIHPGRVIRLQEEANEQTAQIAQALVRIIVSEVSKEKSKVFGYTAAQIAKKIEQDPSAISILTHLLRSMKGIELERLLTKVIPTRYLELIEEQAADWDNSINPSSIRALEEAFHEAYKVAPKNVKSKVAKTFISILKEESERTVITYENTFFVPDYLNHLEADEAIIAKQHLVSRLEHTDNSEVTSLIRAMTGISHFLTPQEVKKFIAAGRKALTNTGTSQQVTAFLSNEYLYMEEPIRKEATEHISFLINYSRPGSNLRKGLESIKNFWDQDLPF